MVNARDFKYPKDFEKWVAVAVSEDGVKELLDSAQKEHEHLPSQMSVWATTGDTLVLSFRSKTDKTSDTVFVCKVIAEAQRY